jgi:FemAB-related protein (PEP-CTERM system-associated)
MIRIEYLTPNQENAWNEYLQNRPNSTSFHSLAWKTAAEKAYKFNTQYLMAFDGEILCGVLPLFGVNGVLKSHFTNGLFGGAAPILADSIEIKDLLINTAIKLVSENGYGHLIFKSIGEENFPEMSRVDSWVIATLPLYSDSRQVWLGLRRKIKYCVERANKEKLEVFWGHEHLKNFYDVLGENLHSKGSPIYGHSFLKELLQGFGSNANVIVLKQGEKTVAGAITIKHKGTISVPFGSARPSCKHLRPSHLLIWEIIKRGCRDGMTTLDLGRSLRGSGPLEFKLGWGVQLHSHPVHIYSRAGSRLNLNPRDIGWFVNNWKYVPRTITDRVGPMICQQIAGLL